MRLLRLFACLLAFVLAAQPVHAVEKRVAFVVGNGAYTQASALRNPAADARAMARKLEETGFEVVLGTDLTIADFRKAIRTFSREARQAKVALLFYAGHGIQADGENYLLPVDAEIEIAADLRWNTISMQNIMREMEAPGRTTIVMLDACRNNPLVRRLRSLTAQGRSMSVDRGLARMVARHGSFIAFATAPGEVAEDGEGDNSPFTTSLLQRIDERGLDIARLMRRVRLDVQSNTGGRQTPWSNSSLVTDFAFRPQDATTSAAGAERQGKSQEAPSATFTQQAELAFWDTVKDSDDPAIIQSYLDRYPQGTFAALAGLLIAKLKAQSAEVAKATRAQAALARAEEEKRAAELERQAAERKEAQARRADELRRAKEELAKTQEALRLADEKRLAAERTAHEAQASREQAKAEAENVSEQLTQLAALQEAPRTDSAETSRDATPVVSEQELARKLQTELKRVGCYMGRADGIWGRNSRRALSAFYTHSKAREDATSPSLALIDVVAKERKRVCPEPKPEVSASAPDKSDKSSTKQNTNSARTASQKSKCPDDATAESYKYLPGSNSGQAGMAKHPCGRTLVCFRGGSARNCWWR